MYGARTFTFKRMLGAAASSAPRSGKKGVDESKGQLADSALGILRRIISSEGGGSEWETLPNGVDGRFDLRGEETAGRRVLVDAPLTGIENVQVQVHIRMRNGL
jgi:hypothetical protein